jgi:hypothetical protein
MWDCAAATGNEIAMRKIAALIAIAFVVSMP